MLREIRADSLEFVAFELGCKSRSPGGFADFRLQILSSFFTSLNRFERAMRLRSISGSYFGFRMKGPLRELDNVCQKSSLRIMQRGWRRARGERIVSCRLPY